MFVESPLLGSLTGWKRVVAGSIGLASLFYLRKSIIKIAAALGKTRVPGWSGL